MNRYDWGNAIMADYEGYFTHAPECHPGWDAILRRFFDTVRELVPDPENFSLLQVKEKYGELRIYYGLGDVSDEVAKAIDEASDKAEQDSRVTCEETGEPGMLVDRDGWLCVRCPLLQRPGDIVVGGENEASVERAEATRATPAPKV